MTLVHCLPQLLRQLYCSCWERMFCRAKLQFYLNFGNGDLAIVSCQLENFCKIGRYCLQTKKNNLQQHQYSSSPLQIPPLLQFLKRTALTFPSSGLQPANAPTQPVLVAPNNHRLVQNASGNDIRSRIFCHKYHNAIVQNSAMDSLVLQRGCHSMSDFRCHLFFREGQEAGRGGARGKKIFTSSLRLARF